MFGLNVSVHLTPPRIPRIKPWYSAITLYCIVLYCIVLYCIGWMPYRGKPAAFTGSCAVRSFLKCHFYPVDGSPVLFRLLFSSSCFEEHISWMVNIKTNKYRHKQTNTDTNKGNVLKENKYRHKQKRFSSVQDGIYALGKAHMFSIPSLRSFPNVPMFVWLMMALSRPFTEDRPALPLSTLLSSRRSMVWCPWLCTRR